MKKISKSEVERIKKLLKLKEMTTDIGLFVYLFLSLFCLGFMLSTESNLAAYGMFAGYGLLGVGLMIVVGNIISPEDLEKAKMINQYEQAKVHKDALDTYNKLNKVFN